MKAILRTACGCQKEIDYPGGYCIVVPIFLNERTAFEQKSPNKLLTGERIFRFLKEEEGAMIFVEDPEALKPGVPAFLQLEIAKWI